MPQSRALAARPMTRIACGGRAADDVEAVAVNNDERAARQVARTLGRPPETVTWR